MLIALAMAAHASCPTDIQILVDSSGSVHDPEFLTWTAQLDLTRALVADWTVGPDDVAVNVWNVAGGMSSESCQQVLGDDIVEELPFSTDASEVQSTLEALDASNFLHGGSWWDCGFHHAQQAYLWNGRPQARSLVIHMADGAPTSDQDVCHAENGLTDYMSESLQQYQALGTTIYGVAVPDVSNQQLEEYHTCRTDGHDFELQDFNLLAAIRAEFLEDDDGDNICGSADLCPNDADNDADGDTLCADVDLCPDSPSYDVDVDGDGCDDVLEDPCPGDLTNSCPDPCDGLCLQTRSLAADLNAAFSSDVLTETAPMRLRPSTLEGQLRGLRDALVAADCAPTGTITAVYDAAARTASGENDSGDLFDGTFVRGVFEGTLGPQTVGQSDDFGRYRRRKVVGQVEDDSYVAGVFVRVAGTEGVWLGLAGTCADGLSPEAPLGTWYGAPITW